MASKPEPLISPIALDIRGAASYLSTTVPAVRSLIYGKELRPFKLGKKYLFRVEDLRSFVDQKAAEVR